MDRLTYQRGSGMITGLVLFIVIFSAATFLYKGADWLFKIWASAGVNKL